MHNLHLLPFAFLRSWVTCAITIFINNVNILSRKKCNCIHRRCVLSITWDMLILYSKTASAHVEHTYFFVLLPLYILYIYIIHTRARTIFLPKCHFLPCFDRKRAIIFLSESILQINIYIFIFPECDCNFSQGPFKVRELITKHWCKIHAHGPFWNEIYLINQSLPDKLKNPSTSLCVSLYLKRPT